MRVRLRDFLTLLEPACQVFAHVEQHAKLCITSAKQAIIQRFRGLSARRQQPLQHEARPRTFH